jgi:hypothetical protein
LERAGAGLLHFAVLTALGGASAYIVASRALPKMHTVTVLVTTGGGMTAWSFAVRPKVRRNLRMNWPNVGAKSGSNAGTI